MRVAGIITEYNPLHRGHLRLVEVIRRELGDDTAVICCMSGDFVQRGDFAVVRRQARAKAAVMSGADLVLELPLLRAVSSAEGFAEGGVSLLLATGLVDTLVFGSERGDTDALRQAAAVLLCEKFPAALRRELAAGISYPAARQRAVSELAGPAIAGVLSRPNDLLGVEYCKSLLRHGSAVRPMAALREGAPHDEGERKFAPIRRCAPPSPVPGEGETLRDSGKTSPPLGRESHVTTEGGITSSSVIRGLLRRGEREAALARMAPAMRACYVEEEAAGRAPVFYETVERAILYRLRSMSRDEFAALDEGREGLWNRLYDATRNAVSVRDALERAKTKRYPLSRLRRMMLWAFLGLTQADLTRPPAYLRPLAMNATGRKLLARMRSSAALPVLTKSGDVSALGPEAVSLLQLEARAADLYALAYPDTAALAGGAVWKESPWIADAVPPPS
ncbi:MAG: nucleotidyltransferase family protein [Oscillibacter sp.]|nr:nucleotidyltransferase family protein [Oscillibacter sp.]